MYGFLATGCLGAECDEQEFLIPPSPRGNDDVRARNLDDAISLFLDEAPACSGAWRSGRLARSTRVLGRQASWKCQPDAPCSQDAASQSPTSVWTTSADFSMDLEDIPLDSDSDSDREEWDREYIPGIATEAPMDRHLPRVFPQAAALSDADLASRMRGHLRKERRPGQWGSAPEDLLFQGVAEGTADGNQAPMLMDGRSIRNVFALPSDYDNQRPAPEWLLYSF